MVESCEVSSSQAQSAYDAFIMSATAPPERHNPKAWANYGCKGTTKNADMQIFEWKKF